MRVVDKTPSKESQISKAVEKEGGKDPKVVPGSGS